MNSALIFAVGGLVLFLIGLHGILVRRHLLRKILAANIMAGGTFLTFIALGARVAGAPVDPVPQAMVLTGIVVSLAFTAVAIVLAVRIKRLSGADTLSLDQESPGE